MQVLTDRAYVGIDFATSTARLIRPNKELVRGRLNIHDLSRERKERLKTNLFSELLPLEEVHVEPANAIQEEQREFVNCILHGRTPSVSGEHARDCLAVAEQILACIKQPHAQPAPSVSRPQPGIVPAPVASHRDQRKAS
jgi:predicted dehydrogenase